MENFKSFYLAEQNIHQLHLEQYALRGILHLRKAIEICQDLRDKLIGEESKSNLTLKFDGAPAIIFGINPETNKFFVSTKGAFAKTPKLAYSIEEIDEIFNQGPATKLKECFNLLKDNVKEGIWQGDYLFSKSDLTTKKIDDIIYYIFKPNTIAYAVPVNSDLGKRISASSIGIVVHTKYTWPLSTTKADFVGVDLSNKSTTDLIIFSPQLSDLTGRVTFDRTDSSKVTAILSQIGKDFKILNKSFYTDFTNVLLDSFEIYVNDSVRSGSFDISVEKFSKWLESYYERQIYPKYKSEKGLAKSKEDLQNKINWIYSNKFQMDALIDIYLNLHKIKMYFVNKFNEIKTSLKTFIETEAGFKYTGHEGFCAIRDSEIVKLVDRLEFSKNNFNLAKSWT